MQALAIPGYRGHIAGKDPHPGSSLDALPDARLPRKVSENLHGGTFGSENHLATQSLPLRPGFVSSSIFTGSPAVLGPWAAGPVGLPGLCAGHGRSHSEQ